MLCSAGARLTKKEQRQGGFLSPSFFQMTRLRFGLAGSHGMRWLPRGAIPCFGPGKLGRLPWRPRLPWRQGLSDHNSYVHRALSSGIVVRVVQTAFAATEIKPFG